MTRTSGALMHISSLPGAFGMGCFGEEAVNFAQKLRAAGFTHWQVLPFSRSGYDNSPYQSDSAFAGNELFIDPRQLADLELITEEELDSTIYQGAAYAVDYSWVKQNRIRILKKAFGRIDNDLKQKVEDFCLSNSWVDNFALFAAIKSFNHDRPWWEWDDIQLQRHDEEALSQFKSLHYEDYLFHCFAQYEFDRQWQLLKEQINQEGIFIIGDVPIYVSEDSADFWGNRHLFQTGEDGRSSRQAGVPPDFFSQDGQLWGNPLYDWEAHKKDDYNWWIQRLGVNFKRFDKVRIDHFLGFLSYWSVDAKAHTAKDGEWQQGPGLDIFHKLAQVYPQAPIIAEDLGVSSPEAKKFVADTGFPNMYVLEYAFNPHDDSVHLPHNYKSNSVAYTSTHDTNTLLGWLWDSAPEEREFAIKYCNMTDIDWGRGGPQSPSCRAMLRQVFQSHSDLAIVQIQDLLGYGGDTRINFPGISAGNWTFRISQAGLDSMDLRWMKNINQLSRRI